MSLLHQSVSASAAPQLLHVRTEGSRRKAGRTDSPIQPCNPHPTAPVGRSPWRISVPSRLWGQITPAAYAYANAKRPHPIQKPHNHPHLLVLVSDGSVVGPGGIALMVHVVYTGHTLPLGEHVHQGKQDPFPAAIPRALGEQRQELRPQRPWAGHG
jgi:hypothetical protein